MDKTESLRVRLTQEESDAFLTLATSIGVKRSQLLRKMIREFINQQPDLLENEQIRFREIIRLLTGLSRMIKQGITNSTADQACSYCTDCCQHLVNIKEYFDGFKVLCETYIHDTKHRVVRE
jgi:coenzyme F420-reducing hydrogenase beta subunit